MAGTYGTLPYRSNLARATHEFQTPGFAKTRAPRGAGRAYFRFANSGASSRPK